MKFNSDSRGPSHPASLAEGFLPGFETVLEAPALEYLGNLGRTVAERILPGRRLAVKVVYNLSAGDERAVITVELGRPTRPAGQERGEQWHTD